MRKIGTFAVIAALAFGGWMIFGRNDPETAAKAKCEYALESLSGYDIGIIEVARATVTGDVFNGTVVMPFVISDYKHRGECVFVSGSTHSVKLDGQLLAGK